MVMDAKILFPEDKEIIMGVDVSRKVQQLKVRFFFYTKLEKRILKWH